MVPWVNSGISEEDQIRLNRPALRWSNRGNRRRGIDGAPAKAKEMSDGMNNRMTGRTTRCISGHAYMRGVSAK